MAQDTKAGETPEQFREDMIKVYGVKRWEVIKNFILNGSDPVETTEVEPVLLDEVEDDEDFDAVIDDESFAAIYGLEDGVDLGEDEDEEASVLDKWLSAVDVLELAE